MENLKEFGYPEATDSNILTDSIYSAFFKSMLEENLGKMGNIVDSEIKKILAEIDQ